MSSDWLPLPRSLRLPGDEVHVIRLDLDAPGAESSELLSDDERDRVRRMSVERGRRFAAAHAGLRDVLGCYLDMPPSRLRLVSAPGGKPRLAEVPAGLDLRFNLSHSQALALVALACGREVGVDVERVRERRDLLGLADRALDAAEARSVRAAAPAARAQLFHRAWVRREAAAKCTGAGIWSPPSGAGPLHMTELDAGPDVAAALAVGGEDPVKIRRFQIS